MKKLNYTIFLCITILSCGIDTNFSTVKKVESKLSESALQFSLIPDSRSMIDFENNITETEELNFLNFSNIYNGGGVATADFNNDDLVDIYFIANQQSNKLYLNKGDFRFEDITSASGLADDEGWSTGVSVIDINNDGWLDIYVCKSGELKNPLRRENKLFINQQNNSFRESAKEWNLNDAGFSTQSYFFDFDKDGDLDMYLVNHRVDFQNTSKLNMQIETSFSRHTSDKLYRNDGHVFVEITHKSKLVNNAWGLSAAIGDFNNDKWPDIYVCNDFLTPDMLYINNKNGTFSNQILNRMNHISYSSMGSDYADINNDLLPDLLVLEMAAEDHVRSKTNMATMNTKAFNHLVKMNYHHQYMVNTLQLNTTVGKFSEIAQLSGLAKTDWSWAPLIADFDNDGMKDVFITNGILKEMGNQDFRTAMKDKFSQKNEPSFKEIVDLMTSTKISNYAFRNNGDYTFTNSSESWGFTEKTQSNGAAYADFDNDGDLDLVINNINDVAQIYKNNDTNNFIQLKLSGDSNNRFALGSKIKIVHDDKEQYQELYTSRGFLSSMQNIVNFGIGDATVIEEILIEWPNNKFTKINNVDANQIIMVKESESMPIEPNIEEDTSKFTSLNVSNSGITYKHKENEFDDYKDQVLLPHSQSSNGPFMDKADVNNDGLDDFYIGGAAGQSGELYFQYPDGKFVKDTSNIWEQDKQYEDLGILFIDFDNDGDEDLYVVSGGSEFKAQSDLFQDRLYINNGKGNFTKALNKLPIINTSGLSVKASDIDNDGDLDLFIGGRVIPNKYPYSPESYILINENGKYYNRTDQIAPAIKTIGMVTDALFSDYDNDGDEDLILVGEWMPITIFENIDNKLEPTINSSIEDTEGIWFSIASNDIDNDGDMDYFAGNLGLNTKFKASKEKPFQIYCDDFDNSGTYDIVLTSNYKGTLVPARGRECSSQQMPFIKDKFPTFASFAEADLENIYGKEQLSNAFHLETKTHKSIFLENMGNGSFEIHELPNPVQIAPIMDFDFLDIDNDNLKEIIIVGNHYNSEVETARHDASYGAIISYKDGAFVTKEVSSTGFMNFGNAKDMLLLDADSNKLLFVANNNDSLSMYKFAE